MVLEVATLYVKPELMPTFEADFVKASYFIAQAKGYITHELQKCLEQEHKFLLMVQWETLENHTVDFRTSDLFEQWRTIIHPYFEPKPIVEHFVRVYPK